MGEIVLTADRTLMTTYHDVTLLGYFACIPHRLLPNLFITAIYPKLPQNFATYSLRRLEATLLDNGFDVIILRPQDINKIKKIQPQVVGISTVDPVTTKPYPWTWTNIFGGGKATTEHEFAQLLYKINALRRKHHFKIIVGGVGATELERTTKYHDLFDTYVIGPAEGTIPLFHQAINGNQLPKQYRSTPTHPQDYSPIKYPARNGNVQLTQGCPRGCHFCAPTQYPWISYPQDKILQEAAINLQAGVNQLSLISEDLLLYGSKDVEVNHTAVIHLITALKKLQEQYHCPTLNISNISFASAIKGKKTIQALSDILGLTQEKPLYTIVGLETGSKRLIKKYMEGKPKPYKPNTWPNLVKDGVNLLNDNHWHPVCSLIIGLPEETEQDVIQTLNLVDDLKGNHLFYSTFYFVPMGELKHTPFFTHTDLTHRRWELFYTCWMETIAFLKKYVNTIQNTLLKILLNRVLHEIETDLRKNKHNPFGLQDTFKTVNMKGFHALPFLAQRIIQ